MSRPRFQPAQSIYDALQIEAAKRKGRSVDEWIQAERQAVWCAARDYAQQHGIQVPTIKQIEAKENLAMGHSDYGTKWALGVADLLVH